MVINTAHRGASGDYPENTLLAFRKALEIGVDEIELDLRMTRDGHLVVMHDATVDRTTDGSGSVDGLTLSEIKRLDAGGAYGEGFRGERVPTWEETLVLLKGKVRLNVHLKEGGGSVGGPDGRPDGGSDGGPDGEPVGEPDGGYERKVVGPLREFDMVDDVILACRDESVGIFAGIEPGIECRIFPNNRSPVEYIQASVDMGLRTMQPGRDVTTWGFVRQAHAAGRSVHVFYADTPDDMRAFVEMGVDGILTNFPDRLKRVLEETT